MVAQAGTTILLVLLVRVHYYHGTRWYREGIIIMEVNLHQQIKNNNKRLITINSRFFP